MMEDIHDIAKKLNVNVQHISRETNQLADYIATTAINKEEKQQYNSFSQLPSLGKRILNIDKQQIPSVRIKTRRINYISNDQHD
uniref:Putative ovule protein n=1 Tax=Solanum chacoense TaxID=4108 RepID=A0A0V0GPZ5_SOLCH